MHPACSPHAPEDRSSLVQSGAQPNGPQAIGIGIATDRAVDVDRDEDDACRPTLAARDGSTSALDVTATFTAFPPHVHAPFCPIRARHQRTLCWATPS